MAGLLPFKELAAQPGCLRFLPDAGVVAGGAAAHAVLVLVSAPIVALLRGGRRMFGLAKDVSWSVKASDSSESGKSRIS